MKKFILLLIGFIMAYSMFAIEPKRHLTKEELIAYEEKIGGTITVEFKIQNKSDKDKSIFICLVPEYKNQSFDWEEAYEYVIPANSTEEIAFTGKYNPGKNFYGFGWYTEEHGFCHGGLEWWAKSKPAFDRGGY